MGDIIMNAFEPALVALQFKLLMLLVYTIIAGLLGLIVSLIFGRFSLQLGDFLGRVVATFSFAFLFLKFYMPILIS